LAAGAIQPQDQLPSDLRDVLLSRVAALPDEIEALLGVAAVAGRSVEHELLRDVADIDDERLEAAMREAMAAGIVVTTAEGQTALYAFRHALLQEAVYEDRLPTERRRHHATYAASLRERPVSDGAAGAGHLAALAHHASASHDLAGALAAWIAAGRASGEAYAFATAARGLERALDLWDAVPADDRPADVDQIEVFHELARAVGAEVAELNAMNSLGVCLSQLGDCSQAVAMMQEVFERTPALDDVHEMGRTYSNYSSVLQICGLLEESEDVARQGSEWARRNGVWQTYGIFHDGNRASVLVELGRWTEARDLLARAAEDEPQGVTAL